MTFTPPQPDPNFDPDADFDFDDEAAGKVGEWERLLEDVGEDTGEPDPVLALMYQDPAATLVEEPEPMTEGEV